MKDKFQVSRQNVPASCKVCDGTLLVGGPIWNQKIHDLEFVQRLFETARNNEKLPSNEKEVNLGTTKRIQAILAAIIDEDVCG